MITSESNGKIKEIVKLQKSARERRKRKCFLAEGVKMVREAFGCGKLQSIYLSERFWESQGEDWRDITGRVAWEVVSETVFHKIADTVTPQGVLGVAEMPEYRMEELMEDSRHAYILLDDIRDPGNLGTILRTAEGAGMSGVVMSRGTVDVFNPKVVRATMGAIFRVPFCYEEDLAECIGKMKSAEIPVYGTMMVGNGLYDEPDYSGRVGVVIGNEANGISGKVAEALTGGIRIPMEGRLESLNASVAAAVLMYEIARQRRRISPS
jgi:rRNA methylases